MDQPVGIHEDRGKFPPQLRFRDLCNAAIGESSALILRVRRISLMVCRNHHDFLRTDENETPFSTQSSQGLSSRRCKELGLPRRWKMISLLMR
jgi:hypothetical protein